MDTNFGDRLVEAVRSKDSRVCVGLDPNLELLPPAVMAAQDSPAAAVVEFCSEILVAVQEYTAVVKLQSAYFEALGRPAFDALWTVVERAQDMGLMVIVDGKRSDIGPTAKAYAAALLGGDPAADAVTVHPYLGSDGILPFVDAALPAGRGLFVLVKTSNPSSEELQDLYLRGGNHTVYRHVGESVRLLAAGSHGESGYAAVGVVVGATYPEQLRSLRRDLHDLHFLVPGYGAQGAGPADVVHAFDESGDGALINASRSIIFAYRDNGDMQDELYAEAAGVAARNMRDTLNRALEERE